VTEPGLLLHRMVTGLIASGELIPQWREVFTSVSRHVFIPDLVWCEDEGGHRRSGRSCPPASSRRSGCLACAGLRA
jgi:hypothetical protein